MENAGLRTARAVRPFAAGVIGASDLLHAGTVTVIGYGIADALFPRSDPVGKEVAISGRKYLVVGVTEKQGASFLESTDSHVYLPITTFDTHYPWIKKEVGVNIATVPRRPEWVDRITEEGIGGPASIAGSGCSRNAPPTCSARGTARIVDALTKSPIRGLG